MVPREKQWKNGLRLGLACLIVVSLAFSSLTCKPVEDETDSAPAADETGLTLTLYFADNQAVDDVAPGQFGFVTPVTRAIPMPADPLVSAIEELVAGPTSADGDVGRTVPATAVLLSAVVNQGTAVLNFSQGLNDYPGGFMGGRIIVESLVYTVTEFPEVDAVQVLVEESPWSDGYGFTWNAPIDRAGVAGAMQTEEEPEVPSGWAFYQNNDYGFKLYHPHDWAIYEYRWIDLQTDEVKSESIMIAPQDMITSLEEMALEDGSIPTSPYGIPILINRYNEVKTFNSDEYRTVLSESIIVDGSMGSRYTFVYLVAMPGAEVGDVDYEVVLPTDYGSLSLYLQVEQYEDIFEQILATFQFID